MAGVPLNRLVPAVALVAAAVLAWAAPALAFEVRVEPPRAGPVAAVALEEVAPDVDATYTLLDGAGTRETIQVGDGVSIGALLAAVDADPVYSVIELTRADGSVLLLSREQVEQSGATPPVVYTGADGALRFLRPSSGPSDPNAADHFPLAGTLTLRQQARSTLTVDVQASRTKIDPGESVSFTATASGGAAGSSYVYSWVFDDGESQDNAGPEMTHTFSGRGVYQVLVTAAIAGSIRSDPAVVEITVGNPNESDKDRRGGGTNKAKGAPDSGSADGAKGEGGSGGEDQAGGDTGGGDSPVPAPPAPAPAPPAPAPAAPPPPEPPKQPRKQPKPAPAASDAETIEGSLLASSTLPPEPEQLTSAARAAARDGTPGDDGDSAIPQAAPSFAVALALLGLGAAWELRRNSPLRRRRS